MSFGVWWCVVGCFPTFRRKLVSSTWNTWPLKMKALRRSETSALAQRNFTLRRHEYSKNTTVQNSVHISFLPMRANWPTYLR
jgi:hypothetical protein